jgi:hypothetical protein
MPTRSRRDAVKKCLFGGTLLSAGLATQGAQALSFDFIDTSASVSAGFDSDSFGGSGPWSIFASYSTYGGFGYAGAWGMSTGLGLYATGLDDTNNWTAYANVLSQFTVTSDVSVTLEYGFVASLFLQSYSSLTLTDLTNDVVLFFAESTPFDEPMGSQDFQLFAGTLYEFSSNTSSGQVSLTIIPAPASGALLLGMGGLSGLVGRRRRRL